MRKRKSLKNALYPAFFLTIVFLFLPLHGKPVNPTKWLKKPFMNHNIPGNQLQIFSPGLISGPHQEHSSLTVSPDGKEIFWSQWHLPHDLDKYPQVIKTTRFENHRWTAPRTVSFSGKWRDGGPALSHDGNRMYFYSRRPLNAHNSKMNDNDIWYVDKTTSGWGKPVNLGSVINTRFVEAAPCLSANGNLYFVSNRTQYQDPTGNNDIYISEFKNGRFREAEALAKGINTPTARETFPFIAPDESYLIFSRDSRKFQNNKQISGNRRMMISFRNQSGKFGEAIDMGDQFKDTRFPYVTSDGKYFIFTKYTKGPNEDYYFVSGKIISDLKPGI